MLGVDPEHFNHDTGAFSAFVSTLTRHNAISEMLSTKPETFALTHTRTLDGEVDARPW